MPISQILLASVGAVVPPSYTLTAEANNVNEGSALTFDITTTGVEDGTTLWWGSWNNFDGVGRMDNPSGSTTITSNAGSFSITVAADSTTAGSEQQYNVFLYTGSQGGTLVASVSGIVVNDTSQTPTYTLSNGGGNTVNEGSEHTLLVSGSNVPGGTYYWTIETHSEDFATTSGEVTVTSGTGGLLGSFTVTPTADATTEGTETFTVALRSGSITGTILATSQSANISDTSLTPTEASLNFPSSGNNYVTVQNTQSEWALGSTYTIEFWSKANNASDNILQTVMSQNDGNNNIDIGYQDGKLVFANTMWTDISEPNPGAAVTSIASWNGHQNGGWDSPSYTNLATTGGTGTGLTVDVVAGSGYIDINAITINNPGKGYTVGDVITINNQANFPGTFTIATVSDPVWTHVALVREGSGSGNPVKVYYDGIPQGTFIPGELLNSSNDLILGRRGSNAFQYFRGKLALIRISNTAKYLGGFNPTISYGVESDTVLMMGDDPTVDLSIYELNGIATSQSNGNTIYFNKTTYPNLNNQVQEGDTVVDADTSDSSTVTEAVYTADPDNWGINVSSFQGGGTKNFSRTGKHPISLQGSVSINPDFPTAPRLRLPVGSGTALTFNGTDNHYVLVADNNADWQLNDNYTIEWWEKLPNATPSNKYRSMFCQQAANNAIDVIHNNGQISLFNGELRFDEPTSGVWNHIAVQKDGTTAKAFVNGVETTFGYNTSSTLANGSIPLVIGSRTSDGGGNFYNQYFEGQLANIRISSVARYSGTFTPPLTVEVDQYAKLSIDGSLAGGDGMLTDELARHTLTNNGATEDTIT